MVILPLFRMTSLYNFEFEIEDETCIVTFYDDKYDIIKAESLAQIGHSHRRKWALELVEHFLTSSKPIGVWNSIFKEETPFSKRLFEEGWKDCVVRFEKTLTQFSLQIYRFYLFIRCISKLRLRLVNSLRLRLVNFLFYLCNTEEYELRTLFINVIK